MANLYFRYGAMGSSKTANALMVVYNYKEKGQNPLLAKPSIDTRKGADKVWSRIGLKAPCVSLESVCKMSADELKGYACVIVDEVQFASKEQIQRLGEIVDTLDIPVICYGLRTDFQGKLFPGSEELMCIADKIECIKTVCWCGRAAEFNARILNNQVVKTGDQVVLGSNESYTSLCRKHYREGSLERG